MDKINDGISTYNHTITMIERKSFVTNGVKKIERQKQSLLMLMVMSLRFQMVEHI